MPGSHDIQYHKRNTYTLVNKEHDGIENAHSTYMQASY
uniref:Uncharacterized protein n=1 Tax=Amphimedon queenslandica TaxID=400682 RepID=A0A1X7V8B1_AMPQE